MPKQRKAKPSRIIVTKEPIPNWWFLNKILIYKVLAWLLVLIAPLYFAYYFQFRKHVEADLAVTGVRIEADTPTQRVYSIDFEINNSGNQAISVTNAAPFITNYADPTLPVMMLYEKGMPETFKNNSLMGGEIKTFPVHAYIDKSFIQAGMVAQESFSKNNSPTPVSLNIKVGVRIRCADGKYRVAISPPLGIVYSEGKQIKYIQNLNRVSFEYVDVSNPTMWDFEEPKK